MKVLEAVKKRRSIRRFLQKDIPEAMLQQLIEALIWAPSAGNLQSRRFYFVRDQRIKDALSQAALNQTFIKKAPIVIVGCTDHRIDYHYGQRGIELYCIQDVSCSIMCMMLVAHELGLGTVWVGAFYEDRVAKILDIPDHLRPVAIVPVGWPEKIPSAPPRLAADEAVIWV